MTANPALPHAGGADTASRDYRRIERALAWLGENFTRQPSLAEMARAAGMSEFHFQRVFSRWAGLSPKKFVQYLTLERAKACLDRSRSVLDAAYESGLSGPGRLHDLFVKVEALTPGEYRRRGEGVAIRYGFHDSPFGECLLMRTERGICGLAFTPDRDREGELAYLRRGWEKATLTEDPGATGPLAARIFGQRPGGGEALRLVLRGTEFQIKVWRALLAIPPGALSTYADVARRIGHPGAVRAVGSANGRNPISYLIPCHRVIRGSGMLGGYRWGLGMKVAMLSREMSAPLEASAAS